MHNTRVSSPALALFVILAGVLPGPAGCPLQFQRLVPPHAATGDRFGSSVAFEDDHLLVGAPDHVDGAAYLFRKHPNGGALPWEYRGQLLPSSLPAEAKYGSSVGFIDTSGIGWSGDRFAVGAPFAPAGGDLQGEVYLFTGTSSPEVRILRAATPADHDLFGYSLSISTKLLAIGAPYADRSRPDVGSVDLFMPVWTGPILSQILSWDYYTTRTDPRSEPSGNFGHAVANDGETLVVGAPSISEGDPGAVFIYYRDEDGPDRWGLVRIASSPDTRSGARFGWDVAVDGDLAAVSAPGAGRVYLYGRHNGGTNQWGRIASISASDGHGSFGGSVALSGNLLAVGSPAHDADTGNPGQGAVYLYEPHPVKGWREIGRLTSPVIPYDGFFGLALALQDTELAVGAPLGGSVLQAGTGFTTMMTVPIAEPPPGNLIVNGSFSEATPELFTGGYPDGTGYWKGDNTAGLESSVYGITPVLQSLMLRFIATGPAGGPTLGGTVALYQLVDLTPYAEYIDTGHIVASLSFEANRVTADAHTDDEFIVQLRSYPGDPVNFVSDLSNHTASAMHSLHSDGDVGTWETLGTELAIPAGTRYLAARISALENVQNDIVFNEFDGHCADNAVLLLHAEPARPEILEIEVENDSDVRVRFTTEPAFHYSLQRSSNLRDWTTICWNIPGTGVPDELTVDGGARPGIYYRIAAGW